MTDAPLSPSNRYHRQMLLPGIGADGQKRLGEAHALIVGCGALGTVIVDALARAGVGRITIVDRDIIERTNLQRQVLFDERDVAAGTPKAEAARLRIAQVNSDITVVAHVEDFTHRNADRLLGDADILLDGLDNFETRYLLNDLAVRDGIPYVYGGAVGTNGVAMTVLPTHGPDHVARHIQWNADDATPCLRCVFPEAPPPGTSPTCDTAGVLGPIAMTIAAHQAAEALKLLSGNVGAINRGLTSIDLWQNERRCFDVSGARRSDCPCCGLRQFSAIDGEASGRATALCGRNTVQISPAAATPGAINLPEAAARLAEHGQFTSNRFLLRGELSAEISDAGTPVEMTLFADGRALFRGLENVDRARILYSRYVGA